MTASGHAADLKAPTCHCDHRKRNVLRRRRRSAALPERGVPQALSGASSRDGGVIRHVRDRVATTKVTKASALPDPTTRFCRMLRRIRPQRGANLVLGEAIFEHATDRALAGLAADRLPQPAGFLVAQAGNEPFVESRVD